MPAGPETGIGLVRPVERVLDQGDPPGRVYEHHSDNRQGTPCSLDCEARLPAR